MLCQGRVCSDGNDLGEGQRAFQDFWRSPPSRLVIPDLSETGVRSEGISYMQDPMTQMQWDSCGEQGQARLAEGMALRRLGTLQDIANGVRFFVSDESSWITGQTISIDGGHALF